jgi:ethanolamine utilization protein EutA
LSSPSIEAFTADHRAIGDAGELALTSIGIDVGSSTSQLVISDLRLALVHGSYRPRSVASRYLSDVLLTPYSAQERIDAATLRDWAAGEMAAAGVRRAEIDAGAVLLTGTALTKVNARPIAEELAASCGELVAAAAGPEMEAMLAAQGSGALALSAAEGIRVLNVDIGGGTTKFAVCDRGTVVATAAIDLGARIVAFDASGTITRLESSGARVGHACGIDAAIGERVDGLPEVMGTFVADRILEFVGTGTLSEQFSVFRLTDVDATDFLAFDAITVSGGVAEFVHGREDRDFGDLGRLVGEKLRRDLESGSPAPLRVLPTGIRATVLGASRYTVQLSGQTIFVEPLTMLPIRDVMIVSVPESVFNSELRPHTVQEAAARAIRRRLSAAATGPVGLFLPWRGSATYARIDAACSGILAALSDAQLDQPAIVITTHDVAGLLGIHLSREIGVKRVVSLDGLALGDFDFVDIGPVLQRTGTVPVVVKSLLFPMSADDQ